MAYNSVYLQVCKNFEQHTSQIRLATKRKQECQVLTIVRAIDGSKRQPKRALDNGAH